MVLLPIAVHYRYGIHRLRAATYISHHRHFVRIQWNCIIERTVTCASTTWHLAPGT